MKVLSRFFNHVRHASSNKLLVGSLFVAVMGATLAGGLALGHNTADAACNPNDIMACGASSPAEFVNKYKQNASGDLSTIYGGYGLSPDKIDRFAKTAKMGTAYKNGNIVVDGKVVATGADSLGRNPKTHSAAVNIGGKTYYSDTNQNVFVPDSIPAMVMMNGDQFEFAALTACGNPLHGTPKGNAPKYSCDMLNRKQIDRDTFSFTTNATALYGAQVAKVVYEFGDGTSKTAPTISEAVEHTYAKPGSYTAKVTVYVTVNGETKTVAGPQCTKPITVEEVPQTPTYACKELIGQLISKDNRQYRFTVTTAQDGGAKLKSADFDFGDGNTQTGVKPANENTVTAEHSYAEAKEYTVTANVYFTVGNDSKNVKCQTKITPEQPPVKECKPGVPVGSKECETPTELPNTGAVDILGGAIGTSGIASAGTYLYRSRRNLLNTKWRK